MSFLNHLDWRFATKAFDPDKTVSDDDINAILESIRMSPSSFGLQPYHVHVITDSDTKAKLREQSWGQAQVTDCSHYLVFSSRLDLDNRIEQLLDLKSGGDPEKKAGLQEYANMMRGFAEHRPDNWVKDWAAKQAYIALGFAMAACAELQIDSCPMEGINPEEYDKILDMPEHLKTIVTLAVGYRKGEPQFPKSRFSKEDLFTE